MQICVTCYVYVRYMNYQGFDSVRVLKEALYVDEKISQMGRQIVVRDLQCGGLDWRPALRNRKKYIHRSRPNRS